MDELEEELKALLDESKPDLPAVPTNGLGPSSEPILSSLPDVPRGRLNISTGRLEEDLNRLTLSDTGLYVWVPQLASATTDNKVCLSVSRLSAEESDVARQENGADSVTVHQHIQKISCSGYVFMQQNKTKQTLLLIIEKNKSGYKQGTLFPFN